MADTSQTWYKRHTLQCMHDYYRLCKSLEEINRSAAMQDARKRRNQVAQDCVRLGKIISMRMVSGYACFSHVPLLYLSRVVMFSLPCI
jgi:hypothetical protein